ncbi:thiamine pyrophosphate-dependent dehydrogenase E1 component subunit alpha [Emcibacter sp.]|uniref:thiamine pyrophosphate-dependent dehydrogenase E1 component subunit alpha n=1 Tax=Emcibacter sp. TaxID=1979954 RepID=UPI002AA8186C|nr:thiamine pyrophosphate-dependent dehydrogenase E1 component subunit alpha [Emcibacter sp.]
MSLTQDDLKRAYRQMVTIRMFEERLHDEIPRGEIAGFTHLYAGQEAVAVGVCEHLTDSDYIISTHRGHGHCLAKGCDVKGMMKEIYGRAGGICNGKGGSMHIADLEKGMLGANGIVGGGPPIAVGAAIAAKLEEQGHIAVAFGGDGSCNQGTVFEAMNMAVVLDVPVVFVFENNGYSEHTGFDYSVGSKDIASRCAAFGMRAEKGDGSDFFAVHELMGDIFDHVRNGKGPAAVELRTTRYYGHFEGDPMNYRADGEVEEHRKSMNCLINFRNHVLDRKLLKASDLDKIEKEVAGLINEAVDEARAAPPPAPETLMTDVYITYEGGL